MVNGAPNRRGSPSVETSVHHSNTTKHWCVYIMMQQIKQPTINYITQTGVIKKEEEHLYQVSSKSDCNFLLAENRQFQ